MVCDNQAGVVVGWAVSGAEFDAVSKLPEWHRDCGKKGCG